MIWGKRSLIGITSLVIVGVLLLLFTLFPIYWMLVASLQPDKAIMQGTIDLSKFTFEQYRRVLIYNPSWELMFGPNLWRPIWNSLGVATGTTLISLTIATLAAYGVSIQQVRHRKAISSFILFAYTFPPFILVVPLSMLLNKLMLIDSLAGLTIAHLVITVPFCTWQLRGYFLSIPRELNSAALVDGCSRSSALLRVILPSALPGLVAAAIFAFSRSWMNLLFALVLITSSDLYTVPMAATFTVFGDVYKWGELMAVGVIATIPSTVLYMVIQKYVVSGLTAGAVKA